MASFLQISGIYDPPAKLTSGLLVLISYIVILQCYQHISALTLAVQPVIFNLCLIVLQVSENKL